MGKRGRPPKELPALGMGTLLLTWTPETKADVRLVPPQFKGVFMKEVRSQGRPRIAIGPGRPKSSRGLDPLLVEMAKILVFDPTRTKTSAATEIARGHIGPVPVGDEDRWAMRVEALKRRLLHAFVQQYGDPRFASSEIAKLRLLWSRSGGPRRR